MCSGRLFRPATLHAAGIAVRSEVEPEFGGDDDLFAEGSEGFAHEFFVRERAVDFGGIEEGDAAFHGRVEKGGHLLLVFWRAIEKLIPIQPSPRAETSRLLFPSLRFCIVISFNSVSQHQGSVWRDGSGIPILPISCLFLLCDENMVDARSLPAIVDGIVSLKGAATWSIDTRSGSDPEWTR